MKYTIEKLKEDNIAVRLLKENELQLILDLKTGVPLHKFTNPWKTFGANSVLVINAEGEFCIGELEWYRMRGYGNISASQFITDNTPRLYTEQEVLEIERKAKNSVLNKLLKDVEQYYIDQSLPAQAATFHKSTIGQLIKKNIK